MSLEPVSPEYGSRVVALLAQNCPGRPDDSSTRCCRRVDAETLSKQLDTLEQAQEDENAPLVTAKEISDTALQRVFLLLFIVRSRQCRTFSTLNPCTDMLLELGFSEFYAPNVRDYFLAYLSPKIKDSRVLSVLRG